MKVLVVYYSLFGNTYQMAKAVADGAKRVTGCEVLLRRVAELMPQEIIDKNKPMKKAQEAQRDVPVVTLEELAEADGYVFGSPTRYGNMCSQLKNFIDQTGQLWAQGKTIGKPAGVFACTATLHGGQESTLLTMMVPLFHLGMIMVGIPYSVQELVSTTRGGTPYGATAVVGPNADQPPTEVDLTIARALGERVAQVTKKLRS
jgi:NAD(P)H dehydrogenase (quinone)